MFVVAINRLKLSQCRPYSLGLRTLRVGKLDPLGLPDRLSALQRAVIVAVSLEEVLRVQLGMLAQDWTAAFCLVLAGPAEWVLPEGWSPCRGR